jgi:hypothetical protein
MTLTFMRTNSAASSRRARRDRGLLGCSGGSEQGDKFDVLLALVEIYGAKRWPIDIDASFDPIAQSTERKSYGGELLSPQSDGEASCDAARGSAERKCHRVPGQPKRTQEIPD